MDAVTYVMNDEGDWVGLYSKDGVLLYEGHSIDPPKLLELLGIGYHHITDVIIDESVGLPWNLGDIRTAAS